MTRNLNSVSRDLNRNPTNGHGFHCARRPPIELSLKLICWCKRNIGEMTWNRWHKQIKSMEDFSYKPTVILCTLEVHLRAAAKVFFFSVWLTVWSVSWQPSRAHTRRLLWFVSFRDVSQSWWRVNIECPFKRKNFYHHNKTLGAWVSGSGKTKTKLKKSPPTHTAKGHARNVTFSSQHNQIKHFLC